MGSGEFEPWSEEDERTAIVGDGERWTVRGVGGVMGRHRGVTTVLRSGETFTTTG
jgi:hypothetical protein